VRTDDLLGQVADESASFLGTKDLDVVAELKQLSYPIKVVIADDDRRASANIRGRASASATR
jgi:hypothetical protein